MTAHEPERIAIPLSKGKLLLMALGGAAFAALGLLLFLDADGTARRRSPLLTKAVGVVCVGFFGLVAVQAGAKVLSTSPGLVIDAEGLVDNASGVAAGRIPWSDIKKIGISRSEARQFLTIELRDPQKYVRRARLVKRAFLTQNMTYFGSPVHIPADTLRIQFDDLVKLVRESHAKYKRA